MDVKKTVPSPGCDSDICVIRQKQWWSPPRLIKLPHVIFMVRSPSFGFTDVPQIRQSGAINLIKRNHQVTFPN
jgi:hypothetical protein